jgi:hypothetical protein
MATTITGKVKRKYMAHYVDTSTTGTAAYARLGSDLEEFTTEMGANVNTTKNILGETTTSIDSYEVSSSVEPYYATIGDPLFVRLQKIIDERQTLDDLKTSVVEVHLWEEDATTAGSYVAYKEDAVIEVSSYGGDTTGYQIPFNIHHTGNRVKGLFALATKTFTAV